MSKIKQLWSNLIQSMWLLTIMVMIGSWLIAGYVLFLIDNKAGSNWISDWINTAVAIGTIGAVIISLYVFLKNRDPSSLIKVNKIIISSDKPCCYIGNVELQNMADFPITLFGLFLKPKDNNAGIIIRLSSFSEDQILQPFSEVFIEEYIVASYQTIKNRPYKINEAKRIPFHADTDFKTDILKYHQIELSEFNLILFTSIGKIQINKSLIIYE